MCIILMWISWILSEYPKWGTLISTSEYFDNSPPLLPVRETTFILFSEHYLAAFIIFSEFPLVLMASKVSPLFPMPSRYFENILSKP